MNRLVTKHVTLLINRHPAPSLRAIWVHRLRWTKTPDNVHLFCETGNRGGLDQSREPCLEGIENCDGCGGSLLVRGLFIVRRLQNQLGWANMCVQCFAERGAGVGWGMGQLYARQPNGDWRLVAGFDDSEPS